jgi:hypothetical protein
MASHYQPLRHRNEFRILKLEPGEDRDPIKCNLSISRLCNASSQSTFDALSYVWGSSETSHTIYLDGWKIPVRTNLWSFLKEFRSRENSKTLWIDAVCIDQSNLAERSIQVQQMGNIYSAARRVLSWLGKADSKSESAMTFIHNESRGAQSMNFEPDAATRQALAHWSEGSYWQRTWIVQEFILARDLVLLCGQSSLELRSLVSFYMRLEKTFSSNTWSGFLRSPAATLLQQRMQRASADRSLSTLIINNQATQCSDPRDRVYAMLGLTSKEFTNPDRKLAANYSMETRELLLEVIRCCEITPVDSLHYGKFLAKILGISKDNLSHSLPSAAVDGNTSRRGPLRVTGFDTGYISGCEFNQPSYNASMQREPSSRLLAAFWRSYGAENTTILLERLRQVEHDDLCIPPKFLMSITKRSWADEVDSQSNHTEPQPQSSETMLISMFTSESTRKAVYLGIAIGHVRTGDRVLQFRNHEAALILRYEDHGEHHGPCIVGRAVFAPMGVPAVNWITKAPFDFHVLRSEAECSTAGAGVELLLSGAEFLALLR